jgi:alkanesulfonate monooxygenase SsuD/methylene tetrahydromethanopterin reductase-like flavin-dependent oxidoreductase (luciferase family)
MGLSPELHRGGIQRGVSFGLSGLSAHAAGHSAEDFHRALRHIVEASVQAESLGMDAVWTCEHHLSDSGYLPTPLVALAAIAERTERVSVGTDILLISMWDPVRLCEEVAVVDQLSGGRLIIGTGTGYRETEFEGLGFRRRDRVARMGECIRVLREAAGGSVSDVGILPAGTVVPTSPLPYQAGGAPLWIGGQVEPAVRRARRLGDGYFAPLMSPRGLLAKIEWLDDEEPLDNFSVAQTTLVFVAARNAADVAAPGMGRLQAESRRWRQQAGDADADPEWRPGQPWASADPSRFELPDEEQLTHAVVIGDPEECIARLRPYVEALADLPGGGVGHLAARLTYPGLSDADNRESLRLYAGEVVPALREIAASRDTPAQRGGR